MDDCCLGPEGLIANGARKRVAKLAQEFVEEHYREAVRIEDLCRVPSFDTKTLTRLVPEAGLEPAQACA